MLSPLARGGGYFNRVRYTHSSTLRTLQRIFEVGPLLGDASNARDLEDLFAPLAITELLRLTNGGFRLTVSGVIPGRTNLVQASTNLTAWTSISTNITSTNTFVVVDAQASFGRRYYRVLQRP